MITHAGLSNVYWAEAAATATCLCNYMVSTALKFGETTYLLWYSEKPNLKHIKVFSRIVYAYIPNHQKLRR